ncbi:MAG: hypothetical protein AABX47_00375, partial [Nanoarchaeota archaeon]
MTIDNELKEINRRLEEIEKKNQKESARSREDYTTKKTKCESAADVAAPLGGGRPWPWATVFGRTPKGATPAPAAPRAATSALEDSVGYALPSLSGASRWTNETLLAPKAPAAMPEARLTWILPLIVTLGLVTALVMIPGGQFTAFVPYSDGIVMPINGAYDTNSTVPLALPMAPSTISLNGYQTAGALARVTLISNFGQTTLLDTTLRGTDGQLMIGRGSITEENDSVRFTQACAGNCFVNATNESVLLVEVTNGTFTLDNITYTPAEIEMNNAPMSIGGAMNLTITHENSTQIDLTPYFTDTDGDALTFVATENSHFNVTVSGSILTVTAFGNWTGTDNLTVIASDLKELTRAEFIISVIGEATEMELVVANAPFYVEKQVADEIDAAGETIVLVEMDLKATKPLTREAGNGALEARTAKDEIISARENVLKGGKKAGKSEEAGALAEDGIS